ncbi:MAG: hypothetical protein Q8Q38_00690 [bacterium]|nr:hypothetical protein [bacterium]
MRFPKPKLLLLLVCFLFAPGLVSAATLYVTPSTGSFTVGEIFSVQVSASSADQAMNAASGVISFPSDKLEVTSLSKTSSIISLWVQEPSYSNNAGTVTFEGIVPNPGFTGSVGRLLSVTFRVKAGGVASLAFVSGSVLANDGLGTNILTGLSGAAFSLGSVVTPSPTPTPAPQSSRVGVPSAPVVRSSTHPDSEKWYASSNAVFSWDVPSDVDAVRLLVGESASSVPTIVYAPPVSSRDLSDIALADGVWYFHVQLGNASGYGGTSHFRFQIDKTKPQYFTLEEQSREDATFPRVSFAVDAADQISGIDHYEFQIDEGESVAWSDPGNHIYETLALLPGKHLVIAKAVDKAGNYLVDSVTVEIEAIESPVLTSYPSLVKTGEAFLVKGTTYPGGEVTLLFQRDKEDAVSAAVSADKAGNFEIFLEEGLKDSGSYKMWAFVSDERGAVSLPTQKLSLKVERSPLIELGSWATTVLAVMIPIVALLLVLMGLLWYGFQKFVLWKRRIRKEVKEADQALHKAIGLLKKDMASQIKLLEKAKTKRQLTKEEEKIIRQLKKDLDDTEKFVKKEIKDIEKEVK